jgi:dolichyl-diphosphooligosaccharide--protein glycosyltransferase
MKNSLMYRLSYYRSWEVDTAPGKPKGYDTNRNANPGYKHFKLHYFTEAFTSEKWIVRIYKRNKRNNREAIEVLREGEFREYTDNTELPKSLLEGYPYAKASEV